LAWSVDSALLTWLLTRGGKKAVQDRMVTLRAWLAAHPDDTSVRTAFLGHLPKLPAADRATVLNQYREWLAAHPDDTSVRTTFIGHLQNLRAADRATVLNQYREWLATHP